MCREIGEFETLCIVHMIRIESFHSLYAGDIHVFVCLSSTCSIQACEHCVVGLTNTWPDTWSDTWSDT